MLCCDSKQKYTKCAEKPLFYLLTLVLDYLKIVPFYSVIQVSKSKEISKFYVNKYSIKSVFAKSGLWRPCH